MVADSPILASRPGASSAVVASSLPDVTDPVLAELEAVLAMRRAGADAKAVRRTLRRIEELLDE